MTVTVLQAGSWGTTLATILARDGGKDVVLWTRDPAQAKEILAMDDADLGLIVGIVAQEDSEERCPAGLATEA